MSIGEGIRDLRWHHRLKQGEPTLQARISQNALWRIELGKTTLSVLMLEKIARGLRMETSELLEEPRIWREGNEVRVVVTDAARITDEVRHELISILAPSMRTRSRQKKRRHR